jgi:hypothetical protein
VKVIGLNKILLKKKYNDRSSTKKKGSTAINSWFVKKKGMKKEVAIMRIFIKVYL